MNMTYEERARLRNRKTRFNAAAALYNMIGSAKAKNDIDELKNIEQKLSNSDEGIQVAFDRIGAASDNAEVQDDLATKFLRTTQEMTQKKVAPSQAGVYATNRAFFDDALLIGFLIDSGKDKGSLKKVEENVRTIVRFGSGDIEDKSNDKDWELETDEQIEQITRPVLA